MTETRRPAARTRGTGAAVSRPGKSGRRGASGRRRARELLFRIAYESDVNGDAYADVWRRLEAEERLTADQRSLIADVVAALGDPAAEVDRRIQESAEHWALLRLSATDRAVLRSAVAELVGRPQSPVAVVIDEAIDIARRFGSEESGGFVNGVLDRVARALRPREA